MTSADSGNARGEVQRTMVAAGRRFAAALPVALSACGGGLTGTYGDAEGEALYEFSRNGEARITVLGESVAAEYTVDGEKVIIASPQGTVVLTRREGSLYGPMGLELSRIDPSARLP